MRNKIKTVEYKLNGEVKLLLNKHLVKFSSTSGDWEMSFGAKSIEYSQILYLITKKDVIALQNLSAFLYFTKLIVSNVDFCNKYNKLLEEFLKDAEVEKPVDEKDDQKIIAEEKAMHEKTPEAIQELENIKK